MDITQNVEDTCCGVRITEKRTQMQDTQEGYEEENPKSKSNWKQAAVIHVKAGSEPEGRRQNPQKTLQKVTQEEKYKENTRKLLFICHTFTSPPHFYGFLF